MLVNVRTILFTLILAVAVADLHAQGGRLVHTEAQRLAKWKPVARPFHRQGMTTREQKLVEASALAATTDIPVDVRPTFTGFPDNDANSKKKNRSLP